MNKDILRSFFMEDEDWQDDELPEEDEDLDIEEDEDDDEEEL